MSDLIERQAAIDAIVDCTVYGNADDLKEAVMQEYAWNKWSGGVLEALEAVEELPSAQPTLCGYDIEHLILIANVLRKENLPPERIIEVLTDIGRIVSIVTDEFEESLRKAVEQCKI